MSPAQYSRSSNAAGAPLPAIPRRTSSSTAARPVLTSSPSCPLPSSKKLSSSIVGPSTVTITPATPPKNEDESGSNSDGPRRKRKSDTRIANPNALYPPELSTPVPSSQATTSPNPTVTSRNGSAADATPRLESPRPMMYIPGMSLRLTLDTARLKSPTKATRHMSISLPASASTSSLTSPTEPQPIRKKSGQVVRSSLKTSRSPSRCQDGLAVLNPAFPSSKSEPATPTASKAVHFDANLEQVKLFLAEQKPLAVSRDGSPTDDTSGTDSDFPWFIYGQTAESGSRLPSRSEPDDKRSKLVMHSNMPPRTAPFYPASDVSLEDLTLSPDATSILGRVVVRNIAFTKTVAVRFTFDKWQTTSEVLARWQESIGREKYWDRFSFSIRLNDLVLMKREEVEGKRLELAVKYNANGRDMWDNNCGGNYVASFVKIVPDRETREKGRPSASMMAKRMAAMAKASLTFSDDELGDLETKLKAAASVQKRDLSRSPSPTKAPESTPNPAASVDDFKKGASFASRYDFANSFRSPWKPPTSTAPPLIARTQSLPLPSTPQQTTSLYGSETQGQGLGIGLGPIVQSTYVPSRQAPPPAAHPIHLHQRLIQNSADSTSTLTTSGAVLGSPRDISSDSFHAPGITFPTKKDDEPVCETSPPTGRVRNHQRGYFDIQPRDFGSSRRTPTGTPRSTSPVDSSADEAWNSLDVTPTVSSTSRFNSFPPLNTTPPLLPPFVPTASESLKRDVSAPVVNSKVFLPPISILDLNSDSSEPESAASTELSLLGTPSSSRSSTPPSPGPAILSADSDAETDDKVKHYNDLLTKFCFYTGPEDQSSTDLLSVKDTIPRPSSANDIDRLMSESTPPLSHTPPSTTLDDLAMITRSRFGSGSGTPTPIASANSSSSNLILSALS